MPQRILCKLRKNPQKTMLLAVIYAVIFFAVVLVAGVYLSADKQAEYIERYVGNKVVVRKFITYEDYRLEDGLEGADINDLSQSKYVADTEVYIGAQRKLPGIEPCIENKTSKFDEEENRYAESYVLGTYESETAPFFVKQGGYLVEGRHIKREDDREPLAMISRELAEKNNLKLGDLLDMEWDTNTQDFYGFTQKGTFKICGIFDYPKKEKKFVYDWLYEPANLVFLPVKAQQEVFEWDRAQELTVYLKNNKDIPAYIKEMNEKMFTGGEYDTEYTYEWEKEWEETVARPLLETKRQSGILLIILVVAMGVSVVFIVALSMRKKKEEIEILTALGEKRRKICIQNIVEELLPVLLALILACLIGNGCVDRIGNFMSQKSIAVTNEINGKNTELLVWEYENPYLDTTLNLETSAAGNRAQIQGEMEIPVFGILGFAGTVASFITLVVILQTVQMEKRAMRRDVYE